MEPTKVDRRVKYTRMILRQSLLELMEKEPIEKITVTDLCNKADINRGTFYIHYDSPYDLLNQLQDELYESIIGYVENILDKNKMSSHLLLIIQEVYAQLDLCRILFSPHGDKNYIKKVIDIGRDEFLTEWKPLYKNKSQRELEMIYSFFINGSIGIIQEWLNSQQPEPPEKIASLINQLYTVGLQGLLASQVEK